MSVHDTDVHYVKEQFTVSFAGEWAISFFKLMDEHFLTIDFSRFFWFFAEHIPLHYNYPRVSSSSKEIFNSVTDKKPPESEVLNVSFHSKEIT